MRSVFFVMAAGFLFCGCAPKGDAFVGVNPNPAVDQASFKSLVNIKWCQPVPANQTFAIAWVLNEDGTARLIKTDIATKQVLSDTAKKWLLRYKTLIVTDPLSNMTILTRVMSVNFDAITVRKYLTWTTIDKDPVEVMTLPECE